MSKIKNPINIVENYIRCVRGSDINLTAWRKNVIYMRSSHRGIYYRSSRGKRGIRLCLKLKIQ